MILEVVESGFDALADHGRNVGEVNLGKKGVFEVGVVEGFMRSKNLNVEVDRVVVVEEGEGLVEDEFSGREEESRILGDEGFWAHGDSKSFLVVNGLVLEVGFVGE